MSGLCVFFLFFSFFWKSLYIIGYPECTKLLSCAYYVGGSFYMIFVMLYKNWGGLLNIYCFFNVYCFFILIHCLFRCVRLLCSYTLHLKLYFKDGGVCFGAYNLSYRCRFNLHHFLC